MVNLNLNHLNFWSVVGIKQNVTTVDMKKGGKVLNESRNPWLTYDDTVLIMETQVIMLFGFSVVVGFTKLEDNLIYN